MRVRRWAPLVLALLLVASACGSAESRRSPSAVGGGGVEKTPWTIPPSSGPVAGVHIGANWGLNTGSIDDPPEDFFEWLRDMNVDSVGISVSLYVRDLADSTVEREYTGVPFPTFTDDQLRNLIRALKRHGFGVYLTLAFESDPTWQVLPRWSFGDSELPSWYQGADWVSEETWRWSPRHADHDRFVSEFFRTYTEQAVHVGRLAEEEGVDLYSLGTETESLFRIAPAFPGDRDYRDELAAMVEAVRRVYSGRLTYDQVSSVLRQGEENGQNEYWDSGYEQLWDTLGFDFIGLSWWMGLVCNEWEPLNATEWTQPLGIERLANEWRRVFDSYLVPLHERHPDTPIMFLEFGYANTPAAACQPNHGEGDAATFMDVDGDGVDDGDQTQADLLEAFFTVAAEHPGVVDGVFLWDNGLGDVPADYPRAITIRSRPQAEAVVRAAFAQWQAQR